VVMLGDVSPDLLPPAAQQSLAAAVRDTGVGLIIQPGPTAMPHAFHDGPLNDLLPVDVAPSPADVLRGGVDAPAFAPFRMRVTATGALHPAFQLYGSTGKSRAVWGRMPAFYWSADVRDTRPGATVLAERVGPRGDRPIIAEHAVGKGRVLFVGFDSTYRWRAHVGSHVFYRFWGQAIRRVARVESEAGEGDHLEVAPNRVEPGESAVIEVYAEDRTGQPRRDARLDVRVAGGSVQVNETIALNRVSNGRYRTLWTPAAAGTYTMTHRPATGDALTSVVRVAPSGRELRQPMVDRDALGALADATGGALVEIDQLPTLAKRIKGEPTTITRRRETSVWDNWLMLVVLVGLYSLDVGVRRMTGAM